MAVAKWGPGYILHTFLTMAIKLCRPLWQSISREGGIPVASADSWIKIQTLYPQMLTRALSIHDNTKPFQARMVREWSNPSALSLWFMY